ncbi:WD repeat domain phosphoinositide-interacting protein 3 [Cyclospora cayetanensis]|uniref:WD repeat domain phosphoinositide-interacting protein 3 n=1 Tax=Cyclospora cayetanensis TaxID=88456 RepID=A0A6P6S4N8_9EIME|nr:WD repeat domain phosphoinositide-interacting protein 3 [Cyclospora cayetanensis]
MSVRGIRISSPRGPDLSPRATGGALEASFGVGGLGFAALNQNSRCIVAATRRGFVVYSTEPFKKTFQRDLIPANEEGLEEELPCSIALVEMLYTCNILAVVGSGNDELWQENVCVLWDDRQARSIVEMRFATRIIGVTMLREALLVVLENKVCIYLLRGLSLVDSVLTAPNPSGLCVAATTATSTQEQQKQTLVVACPALQKGTVQVLFYLVSADDSQGMPAEAEGTEAESSLIQSISISAHENDLCCLCLSQDGSLLASASVKGTLVRIFSSASGQLLKEVRRGVNPALITCLCISPCNGLLAVCSNTGTLHLYRLGDGEAAAAPVAAAAAVTPASAAAAGAAAPTSTWITSSSSATRETVASSTSYNPAAAAAAAAAAVATAGDGSIAPNNNGNASGGRNVKSSWPFLSKISPYFQSEWSMAQFKFHFSENFAAVCAFGQEPQSILALTADGCFYKLKYDANHGGTMVRSTFLRLAAEDGV